MGNSWVKEMKTTGKHVRNDTRLRFSLQNRILIQIPRLIPAFWFYFYYFINDYRVNCLTWPISQTFHCIEDNFPPSALPVHFSSRATSRSWKTCFIFNPPQRARPQKPLARIRVPFRRAGKKYHEIFSAPVRWMWSGWGVAERSRWKMLSMPCHL